MTIEEEIRSLPARQQIALYVILRMEGVGEKGFAFLSSQFANELKRFMYVNIFNDEKEYGKLVGGILGGLSRGGYLQSVSGGRDKLWKLSPKLGKNWKEYKEKLFEVKIYWN